jgi:hypothetical protein
VSEILVKLNSCIHKMSFWTNIGGELLVVVVWRQWP